MNGLNTCVNPGWKHFDKYTFSPAIARDGFLFLSGLTASGPGGAILHPGDITGQADVIYQRIGEILKAAGCTFADVVATREFVTRTEGYEGTIALRRKYFSAPYPVATGVIVAGLLRPGALIEIEAVAALPK